MATVLTCHLIETVWAKSSAGPRAPYLVLDHNGAQQTTEVMGAGAVTVWNAKASFTYAPYSDLVIMAFDAGGRQPAACLAQAVVDVAALLQGGRLAASAQLVGRRGAALGLVLFDVDVSTSSRALAAGLNIPALTLQQGSNPDSPRAGTERLASPGGAPRGRRSPFAQPSVQQSLERQATGAAAAAAGTPRSPGSAASVGQRLVDSFSAAFAGAIRMRRARDGSPGRNANGGGGGSGSGGRARASALWGSLELPGNSGQLSGSSSPLSDHRARRGGMSPSTARSASLPASPGYAPAEAAWGAAAVRPPVAAAAGASFGAWGARAAAPSASLAAAACASSGEWAGSPGGRSSSPLSGGDSRRRMEAQRPQRLAMPPAGAHARGGRAASPSTAASPPGGSPQLSPLTGAHARLRLHRRQPLPPPPLPPPFIQPHGSGLIPAGREPGTPDSSWLAAGRGGPLLLPAQYLGQAHEPSLVPASAATAASVDYEALLREFEAADAAGREQLLYRELVEAQQLEPPGPLLSRVLSTAALQLSQQQLQQQQPPAEMFASLDSPVSSPARAAEAAFRACLSSDGAGSSARRSSSADSQQRQSCAQAAAAPSLLLSKAELPWAAVAAPAPAAASPPPPPPPRAEKSDAAVQAVVPAAVPAALMTVAVQAEPQSPAWLRASLEAAAEIAYSDDECHRVHQVRARMRQQQQQQQQKLARKYAVRAPSPAAAAAATARMLNSQLLQAVTEREAAEAAAAAEASAAHSLRSSDAGSEPSSDAEQLHGAAVQGRAAAAAGGRKAASPRPAAVAVRPRTASPAPPPSSQWSAGRLESVSSYLLQGSSSCGGASSRASGGGGGSSSKVRFLPPARDIVLPYAAPAESFPALAVAQQATAPLAAAEGAADAAE